MLACSEALACGLGVQLSPPSPHLLPAPPHRQLGTEGNPEQGRRHESLRGSTFPLLRRDKQPGIFPRPRCRQPPLFRTQRTGTANTTIITPFEPSLTSSPLPTLPIPAPFPVELWKREVGAVRERPWLCGPPPRQVGLDQRPHLCAPGSPSWGLRRTREVRPPPRVIPTPAPALCHPATHPAQAALSKAQRPKAGSVLLAMRPGLRPEGAPARPLLVCPEPARPPLAFTPSSCLGDPQDLSLADYSLVRQPSPALGSRSADPDAYPTPPLRR